MRSPRRLSRTAIASGSSPSREYVASACAEGFVSDQIQSANMGSHFYQPAWIGDGFFPSRREILLYAGVGLLAVGSILITQNLIRELGQLASLGFDAADSLRVLACVVGMLIGHAVPIHVTGQNSLSRPLRRRLASCKDRGLGARHRPGRARLPTRCELRQRRGGAVGGGKLR